MDLYYFFISSRRQLQPKMNDIFSFLFFKFQILRIVTEIIVFKLLNIFMIILVGVVIYWLFFSLTGFYLINRTFKYYANHPQISVPEHYRAFMRKDFGKWDESKIKKGCFFRFPIKASVILCYIIGFILLIHLKKYINFPNKFVDFWRNYVGLLSMKVCFDLHEDFNRKQKLTAPITIANHVSWFDFNYLNSCFRLHSPVSKIQVKKVFGLDVMCQYAKSLYVDRNATHGRHSIFEAIKNRVEEFLKSTDSSVNPIMIFPEGTVSCGRALMSFKNGAFQNLAPLTIFSLRYECKQFHMGMDEINAFYYTVIVLCLNPKLVVKKRVVEAKASETVDQYRQRCRQILGEMGDLPLINSSYRDLVEYEKMKKEAKAKET